MSDTDAFWFSLGVLAALLVAIVCSIPFTLGEWFSRRIFNRGGSGKDSHSIGDSE